MDRCSETADEKGKGVYLRGLIAATSNNSAVPTAAVPTVPLLRAIRVVKVHTVSIFNEIIQL